MTVDPFIEAEEAAGHSVNNACVLLEVSRAAYYERRNGAPSTRSVTDAALTERITAIHAESKGTYGSPRVPGAPPPGPGLREAQGDEAHADRRPRGAVQEALEDDDRGRSRCRGGPRPHPTPLRAG